MSFFGGLKLQRELEKKSYEIGNGKIPIQRLEDFIKNEKTKALGEVKPCFKGEFEFANLQEVLPDFITEALIQAFPDFNKKIEGFANNDAILSAIESRTSSPIRIVRNEIGENIVQGIYPAGEGAGYAGRNNVSCNRWY